MSRVARDTQARKDTMEYKEEFELKRQVEEKTMTAAVNYLMNRLSELRERYPNSSGILGGYMQAIGDLQYIERNALKGAK